MFAKCEYVIIEVVYWAYNLYFQNKLYYSTLIVFLCNNRKGEE